MRYADAPRTRRTAADRAGRSRRRQLPVSTSARSGTLGEAGREKLVCGRPEFDEVVGWSRPFGPSSTSSPVAESSRALALASGRRKRERPQSLNDEQKARLNALGAEDNRDQQQLRRDLTQVCSERASGIASLPLQRIERAVRPDEAQRSALKELQDATSEAANLLKSDCPTYQALTPVGRLEAIQQRFDAMLRAVQTVQPALEKFYGALSDEQKERNALARLSQAYARPLAK